MAHHPCPARVGRLGQDVRQDDAQKQLGTAPAAQGGVPDETAGLAAALINASTWLGGALGVAIFSAVATSPTQDLLGDGAAAQAALTEGFGRALLVAAVFLARAALIALRATNASAGRPAHEDFELAA